MYYEPYRPRKRPGCLRRLFRIALILAVLWAAFTLVSGLPLSINLFFEIQLPGLFGGDNLAVNKSLPSGYTNILLLGTDNEAGRGRTDTMIVASIKGGAVKLTSIMRDTFVDMGAYGRQKINAAYRLGGEQLAMRTVNQAFGLNITRYAAIDFEGFSHLIDSVGGVRVNVSKAEMQQINAGVKKTWKRLGDGTDNIAYLGTYGENTLLSGPQALAFSRIRKIDSDYARTGRQRAVLEALLRKLRSGQSPIVYARLAQTAFSSIETNVNLLEIGIMAAGILRDGASIQQYRIPADGAFTSGTQDGVWAITPNLEKNQKLLREFIYGG
jgi:LCP family protein required for cell wall assembly